MFSITLNPYCTNNLTSLTLFNLSHLMIHSNSTTFLAENMTSEQRRENYSCDITYVTNSELGFDYLRDNLATESKISEFNVLFKERN